MPEKTEESETEWGKLPPDLQFQFFGQATKEKEMIKKRLIEIRKKLKFLRPQVKINPIPEDDGWRNWRVGVVDGSSPPFMSDRIGGRFGVYSHGYQIFKGKDMVDERVYGGRVSRNQIEDPDLGNAFLSLARWKGERKTAVSLLDRVDLLLLDGSFFGYGVSGRVARQTEEGKRLMNEVTELSRTLLESGKTLEVIKRARSNVIDGWLTYQYGSENSCLSMNDKYILSLLMPPRSFFTYNSLVGETAHWYFGRFRPSFRQRTTLRYKDMDSIMKWTRKDFHNMWKRLGIDSSLLMGIERLFVHCCGMPPFQLGVPAIGKEKLGKILSYFQTFHNSATGLPFPIDTVDELVTISRGFQREFVDEIQAQLIRERITDPYFEYMNPQKEED